MPAMLFLGGGNTGIPTACLDIHGRPYQDIKHADDCQKYMEDGDCDNSWADWMDENCAKTCKCRI